MKKRIRKYHKLQGIDKWDCRSGGRFEPRKKLNLKEELGKAKGMKYKCGHETKAIVMDNNPLSLAAYLTWVDDTGFEGDNSECFECYCKRTEKVSK
jgi:hypothetical protein